MTTSDDVAKWIADAAREIVKERPYKPSQKWVRAVIVKHYEHAKAKGNA